MTMNISEIKKSKPHLEKSLNLYEKVLSFENRMRIITEGRIKINDNSYPQDLIDIIIKEFSRSFEISQDILSPLKDAIKFKQIDFFRLPYNEIPTFALPYHEEEAEMILFLLSRPFFFRLRESLANNGAFLDNGRCPVCHAVPCLSSISENEERLYYCSFCGYHGRGSRMGCPSCKEIKEIIILTAEEEKGMRLELCEGCNSYIKTFERNLFSGYSPDLIDIISLPLDIIAHSRGFIRLSPNPLGLRRM